ncbi:response regulator transcription factor [Xinfangfangia pollutisoli]|uniref:response regulator transcription factor n=1 Tax=Xinfangfangia pollutisoli TaxID=2865960 RepID=UPI001CD5E13C|nr:response regulator [Xinfangfangia pollutisoli]
MAPHVLLIEDEPHIAEAIIFLLRRDGWQVTHLALGAGAVDQARILAPVLVILDQMLPDISGLDILTGLRADPATAHLPVLMLTARGHPRDREAAVRAGADRFMAKPFANAEMMAAVRALCARAIQTDPRPGAA